MAFYLFPGLRKLVQSETLDGDRENWLPGWILDPFEITAQCVWNTAQSTSTYSFPPVFLTSFGQIVYVLHIHLTLLSHVRHPSPQILLVPYFSSLHDKPNNLFSHVKCALCSHLQTSCKSLWLVYTPVYFSCRGLSPLFAITPFKEPLPWKLPRVYADYFPQST